MFEERAECLGFYNTSKYPEGIVFKEKGIYSDIINRYGVVVFRSDTLLYLGGPQK